MLSAVVIISFIGYAWYIQVKGVTPTASIAPTTIGKSKINLLPTDTPIPPTPTHAGQIQVSATVPPTSTPQPIIPTVTSPSSQYKDGTYTGSVADAFYGNIQVRVTVLGGKITNVQFLQSPNDRSTSVEINQQADPLLAQEAIKTQSSTVDIISGATQTSQAFIQSMQSALSQAKS